MCTYLNTQEMDLCLWLHVRPQFSGATEPEQKLTLLGYYGWSVRLVLEWQRQGAPQRHVSLNTDQHGRHINTGQGYLETYSKE